jgi:tetrahydrofolate synthase/dihydrofolate synthase
MVQRDFDFASLENIQWNYRFHPQHSDDPARNRNSLPFPALRGAYQLPNAACALTVLECLNEKLPVDIGAIKRGLLLVENPGRFQVLPGRPLTVLDVGHNPHAARALRRSLINLAFAQKRTAVFSMLSDKDIDGVLEIVKDQFDEWYIAPLDIPRGMTAEALQAKLEAQNIENIQTFTSVREAYRAALAKAGENDRIVVFGSFHTVADVMAAL